MKDKAMNKLYYVIGIVTLILFGCSKPEEELVEESNIAAIHGTVVINGEPVNAAAVLLTPGGGVKVTGSDGMYDFSELTPGRYELKVFKEGCQSFNKSIDLVAGRDEELAITMSPSVGNLTINKSYVDMGSNESNNVAGFTIMNSGDAEISWETSNAAAWISMIDPASDTVPAGGAQAVSFTINRAKLSTTMLDNYATLIVKSTTAGDGSVAELLVTVFGNGDGTNTANDNSDMDYVMLGDLYVQTKDLSSEEGLNWESANRLCENSNVGDFNDWRLPTIDELAMLYTNKDVIGGFDEINYWSGTGESYNYYCLNFNTGKQSLYTKSTELGVRAVRKSTVPVVGILPVTNITEESVTFNGSIMNEGSPAYTERGFVYSQSHLPTVSDTKVISYTSKGSANYSAEVKGLVIGEDYFIRAYAINDINTVYSDEIGFSHETRLPSVSTLPVTDITETTAVLHGKIESVGIPAYTERGFVYSSVFYNPTINEEKVVVAGNGTGEFSANLSGLQDSVAYYVRAYAISSEGIVYGKSLSFMPCEPNYIILPSAGIMVQKNDINATELDYDEVETLCKSSTVGGFVDWRIPTIDELAILYINKDLIGGFANWSLYDNNYYWSSSEESSDFYWVLDIDFGSKVRCHKDGRCYARLVRTITE